MVINDCKCTSNTGGRFAQGDHIEQLRRTNPAPRCGRFAQGNHIEQLRRMGIHQGRPASRSSLSDTLAPATNTTKLRDHRDFSVLHDT